MEAVSEFTAFSFGILQICIAFGRWRADSFTSHAQEMAGNQSRTFTSPIVPDTITAVIIRNLRDSAVNFKTDLNT